MVVMDVCRPCADPPRDLRRLAAFRLIKIMDSTKAELFFIATDNLDAADGTTPLSYYLLGF